MNRADMSKSLEIKAPHFQKDVIIPQIYDMKNIKLIQTFGYKNSPVNKVAELKKQKIQNVIKGIVYKQKVEPNHSQPLYHSLSLKNQKKNVNNQPFYSQVMQSHKEEPLFMEIDQQLGEMIALADQTYLPFAERVKSALQKSKGFHQDQKMLQKQKKTDFFMNVLCKSSSGKINPERTRPVSGLIDEINDLQKTGKSRSVRRVQSAKVTRSKSAVNHSPNLYKAGEVSRSSRNLRQKRGMQDELNRSKQIIKSINTCLQEESKVGRLARKKMNQMKDEWGKEGNLQKTFVRSSTVEINPSALNILKEKRLRQEALARIDREYLKRD